MISTSGRKSDVPTHPDYVPSVFVYTPPHKKRAAEKAHQDHERRTRRKLLVKYLSIIIVFKTSGKFHVNRPDSFVISFVF